MKKVKLGQTVKCKVTGFKGTVTGITNFLYGCRRIGITPKIDKDGKIKDTHWFDEPQVKILKDVDTKLFPELNEPTELPIKSKELGGPIPSIPTKNEVK
jgi:hypothetical protein